MLINQAGIDLIKNYESLRLEAYHCSAGKCTIGYGATYYQNGQAVQMGDRISKETAETLFKFHVKEREKALNILIKTPLSQNQFSAVLSFVYNIGLEAFRNSTMFRHINDGNLKLVPFEFSKWVYETNFKTGKKQISKGLMKRRTAEIQLWNK